MKLKIEYVLLILVIIGLSVYLAVRSKDRTHFELPQVAAVDSKSINRLVFQKGETKVELTKKDEHWFVGPKSYPADAIKARNLVKAAADLTISALVSESRNYQRYDLTEDKKVNVRVFAGTDELRNFDVGRGAPTFQHSFVRLHNDPRVYHARGQIHETFDATVAELRDETILAFNQADINSITLDKGEQQLTLIKKTMPTEAQQQAQTAAPAQGKVEWQNMDGSPVDRTAVDSLLGDFKLLKCSDFMEDDAKATLKDAVWSITFKTDTRSHSMSVFGMQSDDAIEYPAVSSGSQYAFFLSKTTVEGFEKQLDKLLRPDDQP